MEPEFIPEFTLEDFMTDIQSLVYRYGVEFDHMAWNAIKTVLKEKQNVAL